MAKVKKRNRDRKRYSKLSCRLNPWLENKTAWARSLSKHPASRAAKRYGAPAGVALLLLLSLYPAFSPNRFEKAKNAVLKNPQDIEAHLVLVEEFLQNNQINEAEKELLTVQQLISQVGKQSSVLGLNSKLEELWQKWREQNPEEIKKEVEKWEQFLKQTPTYRDGWVRLAFYCLKLGEQEKALAALEKAKELDPLNQDIQKLKEQITK